MTGTDIMELGRKHGMAMLADMKKNGAKGGDMIAIASFALKGIILGVSIASGQDLKTIREAFNKCLDAWLEEETAAGL